MLSQSKVGVSMYIHLFFVNLWDNRWLNDKKKETFKEKPLSFVSHSKPKQGQLSALWNFMSTWLYLFMNPIVQAC